MQLIDGTLYVKSYSGRNGKFNVGRLITELGEFNVQDKILEELEEGGYRGTFGLGKIFLSHRQMPSGAYITEIRARVDQVDFADTAFLPKCAPVGVEQTDPVDEEEPEQEPVETAPAPESSEPSEPEPAPEAGEDPQDTEVDEDAALKELFGILYPLGAEVALDPTVPRATLRAQTTALKELGYRYFPKKQRWRLEA